MPTKLFLFILILILGGNVCHAQWEKDYIPLPTKSARLDSIKEVLKEQHAQRIAKIDEKKQKLLFEAYSERFENANDKIVKGNILTSPRIDGYLDRILGEIFKANGALPQKNLRVLLARNPWPNASQLGDGTILLNIGLVTHLDNEGQLAFVLCHEIAHFVLDHVDNAVRKRIAILESKATKKQLEEIERSDYGARAKAMALLKEISYDSRRHSRSHEIQADSLALELLLRTRYDASEALKCLGILDNIDEEDTTKLDLTKVFASKDFPFNNAWLKLQENPFGAAEAKSEWEEDSLKTHPDCVQRIAVLVPRLEGYNPSTNIVGDAEFEFLQKTCLFELARGHYHFDDLGHSLAESILRHQEYSQNSYFIGMVGMCLNRIYHAQKNHELGKFTEMPDEQLPKQYNLILNFIQNLKLSDVAKISYYFLKGHGGATGGEYQLYAWWGSCKIMGDAEGQTAAKAKYLESFPNGRFIESVKTE
jgi:Zn-dependent protease with chaperone function